VNLGRQFGDVGVGEALRHNGETDRYSGDDVALEMMRPNNRRTPTQCNRSDRGPFNHVRQVAPTTQEQALHYLRNTHIGVAIYEFVVERKE